MILSTGMADMIDAQKAWDIIYRNHACICACTSEYPCSLERANLKRITALRKEFYVPIGFSDHTIGSQAAIIAASLGAAYYEKHFTLDHKLRGPDHHFSANAQELREWTDAIRSTYIMLGSGKIEPTEQERVNRSNWRRASGQKIRGAA
jgi:N-acetylneuraminate synthase/N,N'-diacetyllegionaminate synthase